MYQIFVVEDELLIRQSIRNVIENMAGPYVFCGEASRAYRSYARTMQGAPYRVDLPRSEWGRRLIHTVFAPVSIVCMVVYLLACLFI